MRGFIGHTAQIACIGLLCTLSSRTQPIPGDWHISGQIGGTVRATAVAGNYAYVGVGPRIEVLDLSDRTAPKQVGATNPLPHFVEGIAVASGFLYAATGGGGLSILSLAQPTAPVEVGAWDSRGYASAVAVSGNFAYLADGPYGVRILDVSSPAQPREIGAVFETSHALDVAVARGHAYVAAGGGGLLVARVTEPQPVETATIALPGFAYRVAVAGSRVLVGSGWEGVQVVDVSDPVRPVVAGSYHTPGWVFGIKVSNDLAYVADAFMGVRILDFSQPTTILEVGSLSLEGMEISDVSVAGDLILAADRSVGLRFLSVSGSRITQSGVYVPLGYARDVAVVGNYAFVASDFTGLRVLDVSRAAPQEIPMSQSWLAFISALTVADGHVYVAGSDRFVVGRVGVNGQVEIQGTYRSSDPGAYRDLVVTNSKAYLPTEAGFEILDVSDPANPVRAAFVDLKANAATAGETIGVAVSGNFAYVAATNAGLLTFDISDSSRPRLVSTFGTGKPANYVAVSGSFAYVVGYGTLRVVNVSNPAQPVETASLVIPAGDGGITVSGGLAYIGTGEAGLTVVDISNPNQPIWIRTLPTAGYTHIAATGGARIFVADGPNGLLILEPGSNGTRSPAATAGLTSFAPAATAIAPSATAALSQSGYQRLAASQACVVRSTQDSGPDTLRDCLSRYPKDVEITFDSAIFPPSRPATITLFTPLPDLGGGNTTIDASDAGVVLEGSLMTGGCCAFSVFSQSNVVRGLRIVNFPDVGINVRAANNIIGGSRMMGRGPTGQGNAIGGSRGFAGITISGPESSGNVVVGNIVGTVDGKTALPNPFGIFIDSASSNRIGGTGAGEGNVISGNRVHGVSIYRARGNSVINNWIGLDAAGDGSMGNGANGVSADSGSIGNLIRGNVISANNTGVTIADPKSSYNAIEGNRIGTNVSGSVALPNRLYGVNINGSFNRIGGPRPEQRNVISGNQGGIAVEGGNAEGTLIRGNIIGLDPTGTRPLPNQSAGFRGGGHRMVFGGATWEEGNVVSANGAQGLSVFGRYAFIGSNRIGVDSTGSLNFGNAGSGIERNTGVGTVIQGNVIAFNALGGVTSYEPGYAILRRNSIHSHVQSAVSIAGGPAPPAITSATASEVTGTACAGCEVELFSDVDDEGRIFEGSITATPAGTFIFRASAALRGPKIMAMATNGEGATSRFSAPATINIGPAFTSANSASYASGILAPDMIAYGEAPAIASALTVASTNPWPTILGGVQLEIIDWRGQTRPAPIYYVSTNSMAFLVPAGTALGLASIRLTTSAGVTIASAVRIDQVAPGLYTANASGAGVAAGLVARASSDGTQSWDYLFDLNTRNPVPIDLGPAGDQVFLSLYGTGFRGAAQATATVGGISVPVYGFAAVGAYQGEDVINLGPLPRTLTGRGEVPVEVRFDGKAASTVTVSVR